MAGSAGTETYNQAGNSDYSRKTEALCGKEVKGHGLGDLTGWPTPTVSDTTRGSPETPEQKKARGANTGTSMIDAAHLAGWPTPSTMDSGNSGTAWEQRREDVKAKLNNGNGFGLILPMAVQLAGWPTASSRDWKDTPGMAVKATNPDGSERTRLDQLPRAANLAGWPSPTATNGSKSTRTTEGAEKEAERKGWTNDLATCAQVTGWPTPNTMTGGQSSRGGDRKDEALMGGICRGLAMIEQPMRLTSRGTLLTGSTAGMASGGRLRAGHSRWLMRIPPAWDGCAPSVTRSTRKRQPRSAG